MNKKFRDTQSSYDRVATEYGERFKDEMDDKPFDRNCLDRLAREVGALGPICDLSDGILDSKWLGSDPNHFHFPGFRANKYARCVATSTSGFGSLIKVSMISNPAWISHSSISEGK